MNGCMVRPDTAHIMVLVTDEGRDEISDIDFASILRMLIDNSYILNVVVSTKFALRELFQGPYAIGMNANEGGYYGDNLGNCLVVPTQMVNIPDTGNIHILTTFKVS